MEKVRVLKTIYNKKIGAAMIMFIFLFFMRIGWRQKLYNYMTNYPSFFMLGPNTNVPRPNFYECHEVFCKAVEEDIAYPR